MTRQGVMRSGGRGSLPLCLMQGLYGGLCEGCVRVVCSIWENTVWVCYPVNAKVCRAAHSWWAGGPTGVLSHPPTAPIVLSLPVIWRKLPADREPSP